LRVRDCGDLRMRSEDDSCVIIHEFSSVYRAVHLDELFPNQQELGENYTELEIYFVCYLAEKVVLI
jgi:hypothetical protein